MTLVAVVALVTVASWLAWTVRSTGLVPARVETSGTVVTGAPQGAPAPRRDAGPGPGRLLILTAAVAIPVAAIAVATSTSGFVWDDFPNLRQAQVEGLSLEYLLEPTSGHWAPGHRFGDWFLQRFFPFNFAMSQVLLLIGFAASLVVFHRILAELYRPGLGPLLLTLLYGASVVHVGVIQWWASGLDRVPATFLSFLSILGYLRYHRTRSTAWLAVSVGALAASLLFYVKPVFVPLYLVLIRVLLLDPDRPVRENVVEAAREWRTWLPYAVTVALFAVVYVTTYPTELNETPTPGVLVRYLSILWFRVLVPNLFGLYVPMSTQSAAAIATVAVAQVALAALVAASLLRSRQAWRAWAFVAVGFAVNILIVGLTRIGYFSPRVIAYTIYYHLEVTFIFFIGLGAAFLRRRSAPLPVSATVARAAVAVGTAAYLGLSWYAAVQVSTAEVWVGRQAAAYTDNVSAGLAALDRVDPRAALVDGAVPEEVVPYLLVPYNSYSEVFPLIDEDVDFDATGRPLYDVREDGRVVPVAFAPLAGGDVGPLLQAGSMGVAGAASFDYGPDGLCVVARDVTATVGFVPPTPLTTGDELHLRLAFTSRRESVMSLVVEPIGGQPPGRPRFRVVTLPVTSQETVYGLGHATARYVAVVIAPGAELCVSRFEVGEVLPRR